MFLDGRPPKANVISELLNIHSAFHQGQYSNVIDFDTSSLSTENKLPARVLALRAKIALGKGEEVIAELEGDDDVPDLSAVTALAQYATGNVSGASKVVEQLVASSSENATVQILGGTILQGTGKSDDALALLAKHQGNLEAYGNPTVSVPSTVMSSTTTQNEDAKDDVFAA